MCCLLPFEVVVPESFMMVILLMFEQMGIPENVPYAPMMHFARPSYHYMIKTHGNFATCAPVISHPSGIPSPRSLPSSPSMAGRIGMSSPAEKDALELKIGQPQPSQGANLSSPTSGAIRVT